MKYSLIYEGEIDKKIVDDFKTKILNNVKIRYCKEHSFETHGTPQINKIQNKKNNKCGQQIIIFDKDELSDEWIKKYKNECEKYKKISIISIPSIEIILYAIFNVSESIFNNNVLIEKLNKCLLDKWNINYKEDKNKETINKIINNVIKDKKLIEKWINNIKKLKEFNISNFIDLINFFK